MNSTNNGYFIVVGIRCGIVVLVKAGKILLAIYLKFSAVIWWHFLFIFQGSDTIIHIHALEENNRSCSNNEYFECIKWFSLSCSIQIVIFVATLWFSILLCMSLKSVEEING